MTHATKRVRRVAALPAALIGALALAGCSTGHIGDSWQCPLAEGGLCDSVAAADPAVPDLDAAGTAVLAEPLWRMRGAGSVETSPARVSGQTCAAECDGGFDPFAWLAELFDADSDAPGPEAGAGGPASGEIGRASADTEPDTARTPAATEPAPAKTASRSAEPTAAFPVPGSGEPVPAPEPGGQAPGPAQEVPSAGDLRTGEVVARIWIAPFVDADGVYREASHVRVVLEPAGWRLK